MKRFFVNQLVIAALMVSAAFVSSCNKDDDDTAASGAFDGVITAQVEGGAEFSTFVKRVQAVAIGSEQVSLGSGTYAANGSFSITLEPPPTSILNLLVPPDGISISDKSAKINTEIEIGAYSSSTGEFKDEDIVGWFGYGKMSADGKSATLMRFWYADRNVTVKGSNKETYEDGNTTTLEFNIELKQGWNRVYHTWKVTQSDDYSEYTTNSVDGLKWIFAE